MARATDSTRFHTSVEGGSKSLVPLTALIKVFGNTYASMQGPGRRSGSLYVLGHLGCKSEDLFILNRLFLCVHPSPALPFEIHLICWRIGASYRMLPVIVNESYHRISSSFPALLVRKAIMVFHLIKQP